MKKRLMITSMVAVVGGMTVGWAGTGAAELPPAQYVQIDPHLSDYEVYPGQQVTVNPESCTPNPGQSAEGIVYWGWSGVNGGESDEGEARLRADGTWGLSFIAPSRRAEYWFRAQCRPGGSDRYSTEIIACGPNYDPTPTTLPSFEVDCLFEYYQVTFTVAGDPPPGTPTLPARPAGSSSGAGLPGFPMAGQAPPATPVPGQPNFTG